MSRTSRALVTRSRFEMDMRLDSCGRRLGSFLSDDLSEAHLGLSPAARAHLDRFRSFLQSYYVAKLGYYPPASCDAQSATFPKSIYGQMCQEFQKLYDYLVDSRFTSTDTLPISHQGGICVQQTLDAFNSRHKYSPLLHPLPLLPEAEAEKSTQMLSLNRRFSFIPKSDKMKPDPRLVAFSSLCKATNRMDQSLFDCTLVRAYRGFEKECSLANSKVDRNDKLSLTDARKVRWILICRIFRHFEKRQHLQNRCAIHTTYPTTSVFLLLAARHGRMRDLRDAASFTDRSNKAGHERIVESRGEYRASPNEIGPTSITELLRRRSST